ncbi:hypothetical protein [Streptomyces sp. KM273126]|uniref:hypothetical protein n=1 Tax=Streptomyces sp. KM273126 TaxID=2545247 RepID=UPI0026D51B69
MPDLFVDDSWVGALDGRTREIRCPADGSLVAVVDEVVRRTREIRLGGRSTSGHRPGR